MDFCKKLDLIMNLTKTSNSMLSKQLSVDASYISRLRAGSRRPARNADYIRSMAAYFARHCADGPQLDALRAAVRSPAAEEASPEEIILSWLRTEERDSDKPVGIFLDSVMNLTGRKSPGASVAPFFPAVEPADGSTVIYYGDEGKREAVLSFLNEVIRQETPRTLLLFSEENFRWLTEKREFCAQWASLLREALRRGNRIKIIHSISRRLDEMFAGISEWLPIYMTGMVEPFYYPKARDGVFQRTLFVAPGVAAILSTSVADRTGSAANYLIRDKKAVEAAASEFGDYFGMCRPLLRVFGAGQPDTLLTVLEDFTAAPVDAILRTDSLSVLTLPESAAAGLLGGVPPVSRRLGAGFEESLRERRFHEIIRTPDPEEIRRGRHKLTAPGNAALFYTPAAYKGHLERTLSLLRRYDTYHIYVDDSGRPGDTGVFVKENVGVLVETSSPPSVLFAIGESRMTAAFWDYLRGRIVKDFCSPANKRRMIELLEGVLTKLE